jgi:hypothetical protein
MLARCVPGDHVCWTFDSDQTRLDATATIVLAGARDGHRIFHVTTTLTPAEVVAGLRARGVDAAALTRTGQLSVHTAEESYLPAGRFDVDATISGWTRTCEEARRAGYTGVRAIGDMAWAAGDAIDFGDLVRYEATVNGLHADGFAVGVCMYDTARFTRAQLAAVKAAHPASTGPGRSGDGPPLLRVRRPGPAHLFLVGEADMTNQTAVRTMLALLRDDAVRLREHARLDVAGLSFADCATVQTMLGVARGVPAGMSIAGCRPLIARMLEFHGAGAVAGLRVQVADELPR